MELNKLHRGDCLDILKTLPENSVDSIITDPPYELGFMGKSWDSTGIANNIELWKECLRVLKPGGHLLAFSGTRTYHRMASAIEDAGFEIRDMIEWVYGSGFPKSLNIGKAVDKLQGNERENLGFDKTKWRNANNYEGGKYSKMRESDYITKATITKGNSELEGWGTALKPAHEPICMARKPLAEKTVAENCLKYGTGGINIDESRVGMSQEDKEMLDAKASTNNNGVNFDVGEGKAKGTATPANNLGRFPANLIHDNSEEVRECFPETKTGAVKNFTISTEDKGNIKFTKETYTKERPSDSGNASRFFKSILPENDPLQEWAEKEVVEHHEEILDEMKKEYGFIKGKSIIYQAKASKSDRGEGNNHATVKPTALMEYLIKMMTREGQIVLDPFGGSGTTGVACINTNRNYILIEKDEGYCDIIEKRLSPLKTFIEKSDTL